MSLDLDDRQRAMLREMGVRVWLPQHEGDGGPEHAVSVNVPRSRVETSSPGVAPSALRPAAMHAPPSEQSNHVALLDWPALQQAAAQCQACGLCAGRKHSTLQSPAESALSDWMVVGEPPDEDEDRLGQPFAESAGVLLDNMLKAVGAQRGGSGSSGAYLSNVVKCRPPHGQVPQVADLSQCSAYLKREVALVQPKIILAMGRFAVQVLLEDYPDQATQPLGKLRGTVYRFQGVPVIVTYHPKVLLRNSADKAKAWADLCLALVVMQSPNS